MKTTIATCLAFVKRSLDVKAEYSISLPQHYIINIFMYYVKYEK